MTVKYPKMSLTRQPAVSVFLFPFTKLGENKKRNATFSLALLTSKQT